MVRAEISGRRDDSVREHDQEPPRGSAS